MEEVNAVDESSLAKFAHLDAGITVETLANAGMFEDCRPRLSREPNRSTLTIL